MVDMADTPWLTIIGIGEDGAAGLSDAARAALAAAEWVTGASRHLALLPALKGALAEQGRDDIMVVIGGVIPPDDVPTLREMGAAAVFLPGTVIAESALDLLARLREQLGHDSPG